MKTKTKILFTSALMLMIMSCSKSDSSNENNSPSNPIATEKTVEDVTITTQRVNTPIAPKLGYEGYTGFSWFQLIGDDILYTCASNLGAGNAQFMLKYNLTTNSFKTVTPNSIVCACGYTNSFVTDNTNAFMVSNDARKYSVSTDTWSDIDFPAAVRDNIGESGMSYANGKIYVCGGREATKSFKSYDIATNTWSNNNDYTENVGTPEMVTVQNKIYLLGGNATNKNFSVFDIATETWTEKTNLNFEFGSNAYGNIVSTAKNRYIFVLQADNIYVYDILKDKWKTTPIAIPVSGNSALNLFGLNDTTLYVTGVNASKDFALYKLTLDLP
jgi:N-acetylneuraminic acid mutarotase